MQYKVHFTAGPVSKPLEILKMQKVVGDLHALF